MPEPSLSELVNQYGGEASSGHYGVKVIETVDAAMSNEGVRQNVSPITMSTIAALEVAAHEVLTGGASLEALANLAIQTAMDLAGQIASEALEAIVDVVPIVAQAFQFLIGLQESAKERARQQRIADAKEAFQRCRETAELYEPIGTGPYSEVYPCDLFVQAAPVHGGWAAEQPPRVPYLGQMLQLMTETRWPGYVLHYLKTIGAGAAADPRTWGYQPTSPIYLSIVGSESYPWNGKNAGQGDWFPEIGWYVPEFKRLREAIASMHPYERQRAGLPAGDGGKSLWALYQDLLYAILEVPRHPFTEPGRPSYPIKDFANFSAWVPPLPRAAALAMYGDTIHTVEGQPSSLGYPRIFQAIDYMKSQGAWRPATGVGFPDEFRARRARVVGCGGQPDKTVDAIYEMATGWNLFTNPRHYTDQQAMAEAIGKSAKFASEFARARLAQLGVTKPSTGGAVAARQTIGKLAAGGVISPAQADEVAQAVNGGADSGRLALMLGATAVGVGALAWFAAS